MDLFQFIASLANSLAWPIASVCIVAVFRRALSERIPALLKLTLPGGVSAEFERRIDEVEAVRPEVSEPSSQSEPVRSGGAASANLDEPTDTAPTLAIPHPPAGSDWVHFFSHQNFDDPQALRANPTGVVMEAWKLLQFAMVESASLVNPNLNIPGTADFASLLSLLTESEVVTPKDLELIRKMREMRNLAAHTDEAITEDGAERYANIAQSVSKRILTEAKKRSPF